MCQRLIFHFAFICFKYAKEISALSTSCTILSWIRFACLWSNTISGCLLSMSLGYLLHPCIQQALSCCFCISCSGVIPGKKIIHLNYSLNGSTWKKYSTGSELRAIFNQMVISASRTLSFILKNLYFFLYYSYVRLKLVQLYGPLYTYSYHFHSEGRPEAISKIFQIKI